MLIAVTYDNGSVFQHFGHTEEFKVYTVEEGKVVSSSVVSSGRIVTSPRYISSTAIERGFIPFLTLTFGSAPAISCLARLLVARTRE